MNPTGPRVTVLLPTRDRPQLLPMALRCYAEQDYPNRELLVLDDGGEHPVDEAAVAAVGGRVIRFEASLSLGAKLNLGATQASGVLLQKWDDDDWYAPGFLSAHVARVLRDPQGVAAPIVVACDTYDVAIIRSREFWRRRPGALCGATCMPRALWSRVPYPEDTERGTIDEHLRRLREHGARRRPIDGSDLMLVVRRDGLSLLPPHLDRGPGSVGFIDALPRRHLRQFRRRWASDLPEWVRDHLEGLRKQIDSNLSVTVIVRAGNDPALLRAALRDSAAQTWSDRSLLVYPADDSVEIDSGAVAAVGGQVVACEPGASAAARLDAAAAAATGTLILLWPDAIWVGPEAIADHVDRFIDHPSGSNAPIVAGYRRHRVLLPSRGELFDRGPIPYASLCVPRSLLQRVSLSALAAPAGPSWPDTLAAGLLARPIDDAPWVIAAPPPDLAGEANLPRDPLAHFLATHKRATDQRPDEALPPDVVAELALPPRDIFPATLRLAGAQPPLVTALVPTRDRPDLLPTTLRAFAEQSWPNRELIVLDDGEQYPVDEAAVAAVGGRVLRMEPGITLGEKLNLGAAEARGALLAKMDDDDYFAPDYLAAHLREWLLHPDGLDAPIVAGCDHYPILVIADWRMISRRHPKISGNFCISRRTWEQLRYPVVHGHGTDTVFFDNAMAAGHTLARIDGRDLLLPTRRDGIAGASSHTFETYKGRRVADHFSNVSEPDERAIDAVLPGWAQAPLLAIRATAAAPAPGAAAP